jgi:outer membrane protein
MKLKKKSICTLIMAGALALMVSGCSDTRIGYIDAERVMKESPQIQQIVTTAEASYNEKNKEVMDKLDKDKAAMSDEEYQKAAMQARTELSAVQSQYSAQLKTLVDSAMADIAKEKKLSAIVEKDHIDNNPLGQAQKSEFVIQGGVDVTDDLIQKLQ